MRASTVIEKIHPRPQASSRYTSARSGGKAWNRARQHMVRRIRNQQGRLETRLGWSKKVLQVLQIFFFANSENRNHINAPQRFITALIGWLGHKGNIGVPNHFISNFLYL